MTSETNDKLLLKITYYAAGHTVVWLNRTEHKYELFKVAPTRNSWFLFKQPIYAITAVNPNISLWKKVENRRVRLYKPVDLRYVLPTSQAVGN